MSDKTDRVRALGLASALLMLLGALGGCGATRQTKVVDPARLAGFLGADYAKLQPVGKDQADLRWVNPNAQWTRYDAVLIDPVTFWGDDKTQISPSDQQMLTDYFYGQLRQQLGRDFRIATMPGPGVMRLQVAITDVAAATPGLRTISTVVPQLHVLNSAQSLATGKLLFVGGAQVEGKIVDSQTGQTLAEAVDHEVGGGNVETALQWQWGDAENAMNLWARTLATRLAAWHDGSAAA
jgi:hypothetical protein